MYSVFTTKSMRELILCKNLLKLCRIDRDIARLRNAMQSVQEEMKSLKSLPEEMKSLPEEMKSLQEEMKSLQEDLTQSRSFYQHRDVESKTCRRWFDTGYLMRSLLVDNHGVQIRNAWKVAGLILESNHKESPTASSTLTWSELCKSYMNSTHVLYPIVYDPYQLVANLEARQSIHPIQEAISWLIIAHGEAAIENTQTLKSLDSNSASYYSRAVRLLGPEIGARSLAHAQASILAALYMSRCGKLLASWTWLSNACCVVEFVLQRYGFPSLTLLVLIVRSQSRLSFVEEGNGVSLAFWACLLLQKLVATISLKGWSDTSSRENLYCLGFVAPSNISRFQNAMVKVFPSIPQEDDTLQIYWARILLYLECEERHKEAQTSLQPEHLYIDAFRTWRSRLYSRISWRDDDPPSTELGMASLRAEYDRSMYTLLLPYLQDHISSIRSPREHERNKKLDEEAVRICTESAKRFIVAFDCVEACRQGTHYLHNPVYVHYA